MKVDLLDAGHVLAVGIVSPMNNENMSAESRKLC